MKSSITGDKAIDAVLKNLPKALSQSVLSTAHAAAAKPLVEREKLTAPEGPTGNLVDSIGVVKISAKRTNQVGLVVVGPRRGRFKGYAAHLVEFGTQERELKGNGKYRAGTSRGVMPKKPFVKPSFDATKEQVEKGITENIGKVVLRTMKRFIKK